jgi:hypothetical protein
VRACPTIAIELPGYVDGKLDPAAAETVKRHLESCAACTAEAHELGRLSTLLSRGLPSVEPSRTFAFTFAGRLAAEVAEEGGTFAQTAPRRRWADWILQPWLIPLAATAVLWAIMFTPWFGGDQVTNRLPSPVFPGMAGGVASGEKPPADTKLANAPLDKRLLAASDLPPDLVGRADLFVDYGVIRDLDLLESNGGAKGGRAG